MFLNTVTPSALPGAPWISPWAVRTGAEAEMAPVGRGAADRLRAGGRSGHQHGAGKQYTKCLGHGASSLVSNPRSARDEVMYPRICTLPSWHAYSNSL